MRAHPASRLRGVALAFAVLLSACAAGPPLDDQAVTPGVIHDETVVATAVCDKAGESAATGDTIYDTFCSRLSPEDQLQAAPAAWAGGRCYRRCARSYCLGLVTCLPDQFTAPASTSVTCIADGECSAKDSVRWRCSIEVVTGSYGCTCKCG